MGPNANSTSRRSLVLQKLCKRILLREKNSEALQKPMTKALPRRDLHAAQRCQLLKVTHKKVLKTSHYSSHPFVISYFAFKVAWEANGSVSFCSSKHRRGRHKS